MQVNCFNVWARRILNNSIVRDEKIEKTEC